MAEERIEKIRKLSGEGLTDKQTAERIGHTTGYISQIRNANGIPPGSQQKQYIGKREKGDTAAWYPDDWGVIKGMLAEGTGRQEIADDYGVTLEQLNALIAKNGNGHPLGEAVAPATTGAL